MTRLPARSARQQACGAAFAVEGGLHQGPSLPGFQHPEAPHVQQHIRATAALEHPTRMRATTTRERCPPPTCPRSSAAPQVDKALVNVGSMFLETVTGRVSTEVDPRVAYDTGVWRVLPRDTARLTSSAASRSWALRQAWVVLRLAAINCCSKAWVQKLAVMTWA